MSSWAAAARDLSREPNEIDIKDLRKFGRASADEIMTEWNKGRAVCPVSLQFSLIFLTHCLTYIATLSCHSRGGCSVSGTMRHTTTRRTGPSSGGRRRNRGTTENDISSRDEGQRVLTDMYVSGRRSSEDDVLLLLVVGLARWILDCRVRWLAPRITVVGPVLHNNFVLYTIHSAQRNPFGFCTRELYHLEIDFVNSTNILREGVSPASRVANRFPRQVCTDRL